MTTRASSAVEYVPSFALSAQQERVVDPGKQGMMNSSASTWRPDLRYVVLLRAVNAGADSRITTASLRECVEQAGITVLESYLPSGNLLIEAPRTRSAHLAAQIGRAVGQRLGRPTPAVVLTGTQLARVLEDAPAQWHNQPGFAHHVIFLTGSVTAAQLLSGMEPQPDLEQVTPAGSHIYWSIRTDAASHSVLARMGRTKEYRHVTIRTLSTLEHLQQLLIEHSG